MGTFAYFPQTDEDIRLMLERIGVASLDELYSDVPPEVIYRKEYDLPEAMSEQQVRDWFSSLDAMDTKFKVFVGQGAYDHYTPSVVPYILSRSEFLTAYTPYQAEISQGTLRYIFEFQSLVCALTGLDVANASMYDGPTAAAEAAMMTVAGTRKKSRVLISSTLLPNVASVIETYASYHGIPVVRIPAEDGQTSLEAVRKELEANDVAGLIVPSVNRFGIIEDHGGFADAIHSEGGLLVEYCDPSALAVLKTPAEWGADIAAGDGQPLGIPLSFGGPYVGFLSCRKDLVRKMPGRIVGQTVDADGKRCYVLTLQAREQHIKREKATSNICSNQSLMALFVTVYLSLMGPQGMKEVNDRSFAAAHCLHDALIATGRFEEAFSRPFLKEFALKPLVDVAALQQKLLDGGYFAALGTPEGLVTFCCTEKCTRADVDAIVKLAEEV